jgi:tyrocidine synthetase-3
MLERSIEMIVGILAILKAGGAYLPIAPDYPRERINYILKDSNSRILLKGNIVEAEQSEIRISKSETIPNDQNVNNKNSKAPCCVLNFEHLKSEFVSSFVFPASNLNSSNLAYVIYTSGTTGKPKGMLTSHFNVIRVVKNTNYISITGEDRILQLSNYAFDGSVFDIYGALLNGAALVMIEKENLLVLDQLTELIRCEKITVFFVTTALFNALVDLKIDCLDKIRKVLFGGERVSLRHAEKVLEYLGKDRVIHVYGPTETTVYATYFFINSINRGLGTIPIGKPISNTTVYIMDRYLKPVPRGIAGEIYIGGDSVARGYLNSPDLTGEKFIKAVIGHSSLVIHSSNFSPNDQCQMTNDRIYKTGDLARWLPDGNIEFIGRIDHQVKLRGFRVELGEIESQLVSHPAVKETVVIVMEDQTGDKYLCAYIVTSQPGLELELKNYLSHFMPDYMIPSYFVPLEKMPLNANGKIDRRALPEPGTGKTSTNYIAPRDEIERKLVDIWAEVLGRNALHASQLRESIGIDDDFFRLGGHSLKATVLTAKIHKKFHVKISLVDIFSASFIRELSAIIKKETKNQFAAIQPVEKKEYYELSSAQRRLFVLQQMETNTTAYNIPQVVVLEGVIDKIRLLDTFNRLIRRHESFRTSFVVVDEEPVQQLHEEVEFEIEYYQVEVEVKEEKEPFGQVLNTFGGHFPKSQVLRAKSFIYSFIRSFDLSQAPLLRVGLLKLLHTPTALRGHPSQEGKEDKYLLMVDIHHIISDGVSHALMVKDFMALYGGEEEKLTKIPIQYKDYSQWQNSEIQKQAIKEEEIFWLKQFQGDIPVLELPTDYPRPATQSFEGNTLAFEIGSKETTALKQLAQQPGVTLFMVLVSLFDILLSKLNGYGDEDILVGTPISGRRHADLDQAIGMFVNTLVLRNSPYGHLTFKEFLNQVKETAIQAFENQDYLFEDLVDHPGLNIKRDPGRNPLFDVAFAFQNLDIPEVQVPGLKLKPYQGENIIKTAKFDITLIGQERGETLYFTFEYCTRLFKQETIVKFIRYFREIVSSALGNPEKKISGIEIILAEEKNQILFDFNDTSTLYPKEKTIHELFEKQVEKTPDNIALVGVQETHKKQEKKYNMSYMSYMSYMSHLSYKELNRQANQLAYLLIEKGVHTDTIAAIMLERSIEMIVGILAILKAGGAYLPIAPDYPRERINYILKDSNACLLLTNKDIEPSPSTLTSTSTCQVSPTNLAYIIYTSGTTGKPKGTMVRHFNVVRLVKNTNYIQFKEGDRIMQTGALEFDASTFEIWGSLLNGLQLSLVKKEIILSPGKLKHTIDKNRITTIWLTAPLFNQLLDEEIEIFRGLKNLLVGGDVLSPVHINRLRNQFPWLNIINGYGPTENTTFSTTFLIQCEYRETIPIGKPIANSTAYIVDKYGNLQPIGIVGELWVGGDGVARGYLNNPELTADKFSTVSSRYYRSYMSHMSYIYRTGDIARWLVDGNIQFLGRQDHQVKIRGFRIELGEIESQLAKHPGIKETVVLYKTDKSGDKYLCAYLLTDKQGLELELKNYLTQFMPDYMIPSYFVPLEKMPLNANGKIDRRALPEPGTGKTSTNYIAPRDETERKLVNIWAEVLGRDALHASQLRESISIDDDFFQLGGHSLKATVLTAKIHKKFHVKISLVDIFSASLIRELSAIIKKETKNQFAAIQPVEKKEYYELSSAQKRLYILQQMDLDSTAYNMPQSILFTEEPDRKQMEKVFLKLIQRHESLRTSFFLLGEDPVQQIHREPGFEIQCTAAAEEVEEREFIRAFDLSQPPLLRVGLIKQGKNQHILMVDMHHIISDGISHNVLQKQFVALTSKPGKELPALRLQYKDYARWQNSQQQQELMKQQEAYWVRFFSLAGELPVLSLPTDYPRPLIQSFEGCRVNFVFNEQETQILTDTAKKTGATLYMVILSVYTILLAKLSGQEDIIVGTPIAARRHADLEGIIGMFVNTLAMRNYPKGDKTFREFLIEVKNRTLEAYENQEYPFEELVEKVSPRRDSSRNPIFDVVFNLLNEAEYGKNNEAPAIGPDQSYVHRPLPGTAKFDLTLWAFEIEKGLNFDFEYCTTLFKPETIERFIGYFKKIVSTLQENPEVMLSGIEIITAEEKRQALYDFNSKEGKYPDNKTLHELFTGQVIQTPYSIAIAGMDDEAQQQRRLPAAAISDGKMKGIRILLVMPVTPAGNIYITYRELNEKSLQLAHYLCQQGVKANDLVGIMVERSVEMIIGILGILLAGSAYVPLNPKAPLARNTYLLDECGVDILLTSSSLAGSKNETFYSHRGTQSTALSLPPAANLAYVIFTSGSTGMPKGVPISHSNLSPLLYWGYKHLGLCAKDRTVQNLAYYFDWSVWEIFITITSGACLYPVPEEVLLNPQTCIDFMDKHTITVLHATPTQYQYLVNAPVLRGKRKLETLTYLFIGAEKLTYDLVKRSFESVNRNCRVFNMYGPTEATIISAVLEIQRSDYQRFHHLSSVPIGEPAANAVLLVLDKYLKLSPVNIVGELYIGGVGIAAGYLNNPELTAEKFHHDLWDYQDKRKKVRSKNHLQSYNHASMQYHYPSPQYPITLLPHSPIYRTGDLTRWLPDSNIEFLGRLDHQVKIRGFRIELGEIENRILDHERVREVVVIDRETSQSEKYLCAYIVPHHVETPDKTKTEPLSKELAEYLAGTLPDYMIPSYFIEIDNIPLNPNGKVDRKAIPQPELVTGIEPVAPRNQVEKKLVEIWSEVLGRDALHANQLREFIGIDVNFFELGGHSLKAVQITAKIHKELYVKLSLVEIFTSPTIREMAATIVNITKKQDKPTYKDIEKIEKKDFYEISHFQKRLWIFNRAHPGDISYNMPDRITFNHKVDEEIIKKVLFKIIDRHQSLRTVFREVDDQPVQVIEKNVDLPFRVIDLTLMEESKKQQEREIIFAQEAQTPFDLSQAPLFRSILVKLEPDQYDFIFNLYHIIADGWSMEILKNDFLSLHERFQKGKDIDPEPLLLQYTDFTAWQNQQINNPAASEKAHEYWKSKLEEGFPPLRLPCDYRANQHQSEKTGKAYRFVIPRDTQKRLKALAAGYHTSLFIVMFSVLNILLARLSGQKDIVCRIPTAVRHHLSLHPIVGYFINPIFVKNRVEDNDDKNLVDFLQRVDANTLEALQHQWYPLEQIVEEHQLKYPDITISVNMLNVFAGTAETDLDNLNSFHSKLVTDEKFPLILQFIEFRNGIEMFLRYKKALFKPSIIERMVTQYKELLDEMARIN